MKLTTKRDRWYFWRELFSYMIPMILIVGTVDVFFNFMQCPLHPEWSAPCSVNRIFAAIYGIFLIITIILAIISTKKLKNIKMQIENEFIQATEEFEKTNENLNKENSVRRRTKKDKISKPKKVIAKNKKSD